MAVQSYTHTQAVEGTLWTIIHSLNTSAPIVSVNVDNEGTLEKIIPKDIRVTDANTVEVEFTSAWAGNARII